VFVEIKERSLFPGDALDRYQKAMVENGTAPTLLEGVGSPVNGAQIRRCVFSAGEGGLVTGADRCCA
jgi:hypothetical protein